MLPLWRRSYRYRSTSLVSRCRPILQPIKYRHMSLDTATTTQSHYTSHSADSYESAYFYEVGPYTEHLRQTCRERLRLSSLPTPPRVILDIGGGTGSFTHQLVVDTAHSAIVVDPFLEQQTSDTVADVVRFVAAPAEAFIDNVTNDDAPEYWKRGYHQILLKEVAHHFSTLDRIPIFRGLYHGLVATDDNSYPSLLLITRPQVDIDYPLWDAARSVWARHQPSLTEFEAELKTAGFTNVTHTMESYPCTIALPRWQAMVKGRFWSTFANFTDAELDDACRAMAVNEQHRLDAHGNLTFEDRLLFITACKTT